jgi:elongation factor G
VKNVAVRDTRNFALIGHSGDGKTSLGEALLHCSGARPTLGRVDDGSSVLNYLPEEKASHTTITSHVHAFEYSGKHFTLVDTPGDPSFSGDGQIALGALDGAVLVVSAQGGVKVGTEQMWRATETAGVPSIAFVNAVDHERADFGAALESLRELGAKPVVLSIPAQEGGRAEAIIDLLSMKMLTAKGAEGIAADRQDEADALREELTEAVAESDDELLEKYLEEGSLDEDELRRALAVATHSRQVLPVLCGSATQEIGIGALLDAVVSLLPSPEDREARQARDPESGDEQEIVADAGAPFSAIVFKTIFDRYAGMLSVLRVVSGCLRADDSIVDTTTGSSERPGKIFLLNGSEHVDVPEAGPGDVVAVPKLKDVHTGDTLVAAGKSFVFAELPIPQGVLSYAIEAKEKGDEDKLFASLQKLTEEDPTLSLSREPGTGEFLLSGMGELHLRTTAKKLQRAFGVEIALKMPQVPYRETITRKVENVEGKLKKQSGGKGMFGVCYLTVEPMPRGSGFEFSDEVVGGAIPRGLIPAVEKGVMEGLGKGPLGGFPLVDLRVRCIDGKHHSVDSNEMSFKIAGQTGLKKAVELARPCLLEPIMTVEVVTPEQCVGDVMGSLSSRRGVVQDTQMTGTNQLIRARVPMAEILDYTNVLTSLTGGRADFHMSFSHYEEVGAQIAERVLEQKSKQS